MSAQEAGSSKDKSKAPPKTRNYGEVKENPLDTRLSKGENSQIGGCDSPQQTANVCPKHKAHEYLTSHKIFELNNYLISHLLIDEPDNPIEYLADLIEKCLLFKTGQGPPPLIFTDRHIDGIFQSFDPLHTGSITLDQYNTAIKLLGIADYNQNPRECVPGKVDKEVFHAEVKKCMINGLEEIIGKNSK
ncbi:uncharacterized protein LOC123258408 [Cotesia glomerata]|uniref:uncharacterized protein LOC123258408 n=1 Tax=Cotesia glomerata TaxID=32391 RepID=UPI001D004BD8|nr:uncharacterized protein LOC123258408 [Cotesia glomerata]XP_044574330.1 uncharacterized protein LOC123258408 [Cotesia glomerata]XP_044574331.1 uncharacterized protein LOC123258408 [Cotesia glomerata]